MKTYPAITMLQVWAFCVVAFLVLPFELVNRTITPWGLFVLAMFIGSFCVGGVACTLREHYHGHQTTPQPAPFSGIDFKTADRVLTAVAVICIGLLLLQVVEGQFLDLKEAWQIRSDRATALMAGEQSESGALFQICFLLYPASYLILAREIVFRSELRLIRLAGLGLLPIVLMSLVMGGRGPILYALVLVAVSFRVKRRLFDLPKTSILKRLTPRALLFSVAAGIVSLVALNYFVNVFIVRAESAGGVEAMFDIGESSWGVSFSGPGADLLTNLIGRGNTYLVFVFSWYLVQGLVMSNALFTDYIGPAHYGVSGIDLVTAVMRRVDGDFVNRRFLELIDLNTYGFFGSAFGSLYVDFKIFGFVVSFIWGYLATLVYHRTVRSSDARWFLIAPFVLIGIFFSLINTPLGFGNGATTHIWMIIVFLMARPKAFAVNPVMASMPHGNGATTRENAKA